VPLNKQMAAALDRMEYKRAWGFYFQNPYTHEARSISYVAERIREQLPGKYTTHSLRHRAASTAYSATHDIRAVQELLGHSSVATTQIYTATYRDDLIKAVSANEIKMPKPTTRAKKTIGRRAA
jgi:integrase